MKAKSKSNTKHRQKKASKAQKKAVNSWENNVGHLFSFVRWWIENNQPTELTVKLRFIKILRLGLIVLILAILDNDGHAKVIFDFLNSLNKLLPYLFL